MPTNHTVTNESSMLKKLQHKFILLNLLTVAAVLLLTFVSICYLDYQQDYLRVENQLSHALETAMTNGEILDEGVITDISQSSHPAASKIASSASSSSSSKSGRIKIGPDVDGRIAVGVYCLKKTGLEEISAYTTAELSSDEALRSAGTAIAALDDGFGKLSNLSVYYCKRTADDGTVYAAFASTDETEGWKNLALMFGGASIAVMGVFFIISLFFSRWALRPVWDAWTQRKRFIADVSHDLKTPLTVILANSSILKAHPEKTIASQSQWIESTENEANQMQGMVNDLLLLARLDEGAGLQVNEPVDFSNLVEGELLEFESVAFENGIELNPDITSGLQVTGDESRLRRLISALLDNACKYTERGNTINVSLVKSENRKLRFSVNNEGTIIDPADLPYVFDRFFRADKSRTSSKGGTGSHGLGLAIARGIAEDRGGSLMVTSDEKNGTTFTAELPLR